MAPTIPTHRPLLTPTRVALAVVFASLLCSAFLAADAIHAATPGAEARPDCMATPPAR